MLGSQEIEKLYIGSTVLYQKSSSTPSESFFCKLELTDGTIVDLEGSGELTKAMVATPYANTLYKMHVGNLCTSIGYQAAVQCKQLVELVVDEGVTTVDGQAFNGDSKLEVIDFPSTLTSIGAYSFHNMGTSTNTVIIRAITPPSIGNNNLFDSANTTIYVPNSSLSTYQTEWSGWATRIKALSVVFYDAEIEYLESTGTQWIDTLIHPVTGYGFELYGGFTVFNNNEFFGGGSNYNNGLGICTHGGAGSYGIVVGTTEVCTLPAANNVMHLFLVNTDGTVYVDNEYKGQSNTGMPEGTYTMNIFRHSSTKVTQSEKIYYCKIFNNKGLVFDGIPVRKDGIGYMFDKVSKTLFANQGTGSFTLGPDKT